jgi:hypothetical protein
MHVNEFVQGEDGLAEIRERQGWRFGFRLVRRARRAFVATGYHQPLRGFGVDALKAEELATLLHFGLETRCKHSQLTLNDLGGNRHQTMQAQHRPNPQPCARKVRVTAVEQQIRRFEFGRARRL